MQIAVLAFVKTISGSLRSSFKDPRLFLLAATTALLLIAVVCTLFESKYASDRFDLTRFETSRRAGQMHGELLQTLHHLQAAMNRAEAAGPLVPPRELLDQIANLHRSVDLAAGNPGAVDAEGFPGALETLAQLKQDMQFAGAQFAPDRAASIETYRQVHGALLRNLASLGHLAVTNSEKELSLDTSLRQNLDNLNLRAQLLTASLVLVLLAAVAVLAREMHRSRCDAEEQAAARHEAEVANRTKSQFLANMSHELRTPLNAIIGFSEVMSSEMLGPINNSFYKEYAGDIHSGGRHLLDVINDILDMSKVEAGRITLEEDEADLCEIARRAAKLVEVKARDKNILLELDLPKSPIMIIADERILKQVLLNTLTNGVKFTKKGGAVTLTLRVNSAGRPVITIADTGIGISANDLLLITKPFHQAANTYAREQEGTGLGLSIAKTHVELHGGDLMINSELGKGTQVRISLPAARLLSFAPKESEASAGQTLSATDAASNTQAAAVTPLPIRIPLCKAGNVRP